MHKRSVTKHEATLKAASRLNPQSLLSAIKEASLQPATAQAYVREHMLQNMFTYFKNAAYTSKPAQDYIKQRSLNATKLKKTNAFLFTPINTMI